MTIRALSLTQPWASLIALGEKRIETRSWGTTYRGLILIHAAKSLAGVGGVHGLNDLCADAPFADILGRRWKDIPGAPFGTVARGEWQRALPRGVIVAVATLDRVDVMTEGWIRTQTVAEPREIPLGHYAPGRRAWILTRVVALPDPVPCNGQPVGNGRFTAQGLWTPPDDVADRAIAQAREAEDR